MLTMTVIVVTSCANCVRDQATTDSETSNQLTLLTVTVLLGPTYTFDSYHHRLKHITKWDSILMSEEDIRVGLQIPLVRTVVDFVCSVVFGLIVFFGIIEASHF